MSSDLSSILNRGSVVSNERDPLARGWKIGDIPTLIGGLQDNVPPELIQDVETPLSENLSFRNRRVRVDTGYKKFSSTLIDEPPKGTFEHVDNAGTITPLVVTDSTVFKYNVTTDEWEIVRGTASATTTTENRTAGQLTVAVVDDTGYIVGQWISIVLDTGGKHTALLTSVAANVLGFSAHAFPSSSTSGAAVIQGPALSGDDDNQIVWQPVPSGSTVGWTAFTNGVDPPFKYDPALDTCIEIPGLPGGAGQTVCRSLALFRDALFVLGLTEGGVERLYKYAWSDPGNPDEWDLGNSGNNSLLDTSDTIVTAKPLGASLAIYRDNSIVRLDFRGAVGALFSPVTTVHGEDKGSQPVGAVSPNAVFALADEHVVLSKDGIYLYNGGFNTKLVSSNIFRSVFSSEGDFNITTAHRAFLTFMDQSNELFIFYPSSTATTFCNNALVWDLEQQIFRKRVWAEDEVTCAGLHSAAENATGVAIDDLVGTIDEQTFTLQGSAVGLSKSTLLLGLNTTRKTVDYDYFSPDDDGTVITWFIHTKDFDGRGRELTHDYIEVMAGSLDFTAQFSTDRGQTSFLLGGFINDTSLSARRYHNTFTASRWRYILSGTGGGTEIGRISFRYKEASDIGLA